MRQGEKRSVVQFLKQGGVGVLPTDTLYGLVGSALSEKAVTRIYRLRKRNLKKPMIVLASEMRDLKKFGIRLNPQSSILVAKLWPGKVSIILPIRDRRFAKRLRYLHRGTKTIAFRVPAKKSLRDMLKKTGPLVAPSANIEGKPPAKTIAEAKKYFGSQVDFYINGGRLISKPSTLVEISKEGNIKVLRPGAHGILKSNARR